MLPEDWLRAVARRHLSPEDMAKVASPGDWDTLMDLLRRRLSEQSDRHKGGSKWIGTGDTSPFRNGGYHPEGVRIGGESHHAGAVRV